MDISSVDELLTTTRAVRKRLDLTRPVGRDVILECIRLAMQAPTASNEQDWRWVVVTDADKRAAIADIYQSIGAEYLAHAAATSSDPQTRRVYQSALGLTETLAKVPVHVIPCLNGRFDGSNLLAAASAWASIIPAGWSFLLALRSRGLGSVWTTMHLAKEREVGELLGIPATATQAALFPVAYTIGTDFRPASRPPAEIDHFLEHLGRALMQSYTVRFHIDAPPRKVWRVLHPKVPPNSPRPRVLEWPTGRMEILNEGDEAGEGLVRTCVFEVPKYLLSGGKGRSWESVTEAKIDKLSRYVAVGKPLWSRAEGYHELEEQPDGTTVLTFHETYHAYNPVLRFLLERPVHAKISRDNLRTYEHALGYAGHVTRLT